MLFNSFAFLLFFPVVCIIYYIIPSKYTKERNWFLLLASYYFYMNWEPIYALLLLTSTIITYSAALGISHFEDRLKKKICLWLNIASNLSILFLFKYYNFLAGNIETCLQTCGIHINIPSFNFLLPVGISFYTFQALGYSIDVYRGTTKVERNLAIYALFVSFFPQLVAGPIERSNNLLPQFKERHIFDYHIFMKGLRMMVWGFFLKLVIADRCAIYVDVIYNHLEYHNGGSFFIASLLFPFQIYGDFAGYSLVAIGAARIIGFRLMDNFWRPYFSTSVGEFWHRWHISLSTWFKDYVYIPMGGNRVSKFRCQLNLLITFIISGIWHGANWTFLCWGALHGILLCIEKSLKIGKETYKGIKKFIHWIITFIVVCFAWILFRADSISDAWSVILGISTNMEIPDEKQYGILLAICISMILLICKESVSEYKWEWCNKLYKSSLIEHLYIIFMISYILLFGVFRGDQFIYFQF